MRDHGHGLGFQRPHRLRSIGVSQAMRLSLGLQNVMSPSVGCPQVMSLKFGNSCLDFMQTLDFLKLGFNQISTRLL